jgi:hypothetical protein
VVVDSRQSDDERPPSDVVEPSIVTEELFHYTSLGPTTGSTIRKLANLKPTVLATMHGPSFSGDGAAVLNAWGDHYDMRLHAALEPSRLISERRRHVCCWPHPGSGAMSDLSPRCDKSGKEHADLIVATSVVG